MSGATSTVQPEDRPPRDRGSEATADGVEQLDTIQQRLFAIMLGLGLASGNSTDAATAAELRRLEHLIAELITDIRAWARRLPAPGSDGMGTADGDPQGRSDVRGRAGLDTAHGRDRR
jgi:signal transduction histidine kinase